jgi:hypothetical protein
MGKAAVSAIDMGSRQPRAEIIALKRFHLSGQFLEKKRIGGYCG